MRILHTSDWHLGRSFHRVGLLEHQARVLDDLVGVVAAESVDVVVVAGDVYDRALPSLDAVAVLDDALAALLGTGAQVLVTSGNHDSAVRLGFAGAALERAGLHLRTRVADLARPLVLGDAHGPVALYGLPYLEPALVAEAVGAARTHPGVVGAAMDAVRADLAARRARDPRTRSVVAAHAFVAGGAPSDSERELVVGGLGAVPASVFAGVDYAALGHLHGAQVVTARADGGRGDGAQEAGEGDGAHEGVAPAAVRYAGSPLAYSFSEAGHVKSAWLVELGPGGVERVDAVPTLVPRPLARLRGHLADLLADPGLAGAERSWCQVVLTDAVRPREPLAALAARFPHVVSLSLEPEGAPAAAASYAERVAGLDDAALCCSFVDHVRGSAPAPAERDLVVAALEAVRLAEASR